MKNQLVINLFYEKVFNMQRAGWQNCTLWQSFGFSVGSWDFANVCNVGGVSFFWRVGEKNKINSYKFALSYQKAKFFPISILSLPYLLGSLSFYTCCQRLSICRRCAQLVQPL